jgi:Holliday junction resolvase RusA-like endonuclease
MCELERETIYGQVISKANNYQVGNNKHGSRYIIKSPQIRAYEHSFCEQCKIYRDKAIDRRFTLYLAVYESSIRYDLDNALKTILDCLQMVRAIKDDNLCAKIIAEKRIDKGNPRITFAIQEHEPRIL